MDWNSPQGVLRKGMSLERDGYNFYVQVADRASDERGRAMFLDLANQEKYELEVIQTYLPAQLSEAEIDALVDQAIAAAGATSAKDMGKVMNTLRPQVQGRADMGAVSAKLKAKLAG